MLTIQYRQLTHVYTDTKNFGKLFKEEPTLIKNVKRIILSRLHMYVRKQTCNQETRI